MKKLISLILVICMCVSLISCFASCDTENEQAENTTTNNKSDNNEENTTEKPTTEENTTEEATTEENTTEANRKLTEEEWYALADPELYTNFTVIATQIDKFFKTVSETRLVDEYLYVSYTLYDPNTGESYSHKGSNSLDAAIMATLLPDMKDYSKMEYDAVNDIYRYSEPFEVIDRSNPDNPITITYTTYEWTIKDGRIHKIYCKFWYIDSQEGRINATQTSEYINYGTTVAP